MIAARRTAIRATVALRSDRYPDRPAAERTTRRKVPSERATPRGRRTIARQQDRSAAERSSRRSHGERSTRPLSSRRSARGDDARNRPSRPPAMRWPSSDAGDAITGPAAAPAPAMLRADDGDVSHAPAFLQVRPPNRGKKARRNRRRRRAGVVRRPAFDQPRRSRPRPAAVRGRLGRLQGGCGARAIAAGRPGPATAPTARHDRGRGAGMHASMCASNGSTGPSFRK